MEINDILMYIRKEIDKIKEENHMDIIVKDSIFEVLNTKCTVIYYPLPDEKNRGFHIKKLVNDKLEDFVYINTDKTVEQQVFTAAHEMGHVCNVFQKVVLLAKRDGLEIDLEDVKLEEDVTNKFAAELLMPKKEFIEKTYGYLRETEYGDKISVISLMKIISYLMDDFMSPFNAVRKRLFETDILSSDSDNYLRENKEKLEKLVNIIKKDENSLINSNTNIKMIPGLRDMLDEASIKENIDQGLIAKIKADFDLEDIEDLGDIINIKVSREE